ncbi:hypothetical protein [Streptomyces sp. RKAG293]|uniref:hypothetical protein n=1 Tax=Streptomyces sp. RKAG293 TaxID=2893403 RepID=UPI0020333369|nr:hypothetical protein [Streptomyces sp. RKAG293]MCM2416784.1 hypothetical protein [Streptomyces sp. RKAG293]
MTTGIVGAGLTWAAAPASADVPASQPIQYVTQSFYGSSSSGFPYGTGFRRGVVYCPAGMRAFGVALFGVVED